ncbi:serine hydrolase domain-containing protein [Salinicoccus kekensis]|uniref:CubicO group peptidase (Beta-lactamase class C family) n=1 Tax=Salinicoccus kekensis TaxID=714307 RepID=A0A285UFG3_9STAP|nr:serine hydrolase domain-containing protein [Salinicoccus kekensis]SOC40610.1 CubicO group peptidase (beta-lactamase class C family) [Salinicoccus kekensis]
MKFLTRRLNMMLSVLIIGFLPHQEMTDYIPLESLEKDEQIENLIFERIDYDTLHGAVFMIENDGELTAAASGNLDLDTPISIASVTKMFTASVIFQMIEADMLSMDDTIDMYLTPEEYSGLHIYDGMEYSGSITISQLLTHTTGLPAYAESEAEGLTLVEDSIDNGETFTFESKLDDAKGKGARFINGTGAYYADINYDILGEIIERASGGTLESQYESYIFEPLGLSDTEFADDADAVPPVAVDGEPADITPILANMRASGGIVSTASDLLTFTKAFFEGEMFDTVFIEKDMQDIQFLFHQYGSGVMKFDVAEEIPVLQLYPLTGHAGITGSFAFYNEGLDAYIVGTTNQADDPMLTYELIQQFLEVTETEE